MLPRSAWRVLFCPPAKTSGSSGRSPAGFAPPATALWAIRTGRWVAASSVGCPTGFARSATALWAIRTYGDWVIGQMGGDDLDGFRGLAARNLMGAYNGGNESAGFSSDFGSGGDGIGGAFGGFGG